MKTKKLGFNLFAALITTGLALISSDVRAANITTPTEFNPTDLEKAPTGTPKTVQLSATLLTDQANPKPMPPQNQTWAYTWAVKSVQYRVTPDAPLTASTGATISNAGLLTSNFALAGYYEITVNVKVVYWPGTGEDHWVSAAAGKDGVVKQTVVGVDKVQVKRGADFIDLPAGGLADWRTSVKIALSASKPL